MKEKPMLTNCYEQGIVCYSCGEDVNIHRCEECLQRFHDEDLIYCIDSSHRDAKHWHKDCFDKVLEG